MSEQLFQFSNFIFPTLKNAHIHNFFVFYCTCTSGAKCVSIICKCIKQSTATSHFWLVIYSALSKPHARPPARAACWPCSTPARRLGKMTSRFVHPVEGDWNGALHLGPGDLGQVLGVEDEEVSRSLGAGSHHDGQQDSWGHIINVSHGRSEQVSHRKTAVSVPLSIPSSSSTPSGVWTNRGSEGYESGSCHTQVSLVFTFSLQIL